MGANSSNRSRSSSQQSSDSSSEDEDGVDYFVNEDLLIEVLSRVPARDLLTSCNRVCRQWHELIHGHGVWKRKCLRDGKVIPPYKFQVIPTHYYRHIYLRNPYGRNLLKNPCGEDAFKHWTITQNGGHGWKVENPPGGADPVPNEVGSQSCFATSYGMCEKFQTIDLVSEGILPEVIEKIRPEILIGEWHAARFDCGSKYELIIVLKDRDRNELRSLNFGPFKEEQWAGSAWSKVSHVIGDYPEGLRYIDFIHSGIDNQFWAGHYGSKMTGCYVKLKIS